MLPGMVVCPCSPSTGEAEAGWWRVWDYVVKPCIEKPSPSKTKQKMNFLE
jgi:hypothetical protein